MQPLVKSLVVVLALLGFSANAVVAKSVDFSEFAGKFKGTVTLVSSGTPFPGAAQIRAVVPKSEDFVTFKFSGAISDSGTIVPLTNTFIFLSPKTFVTQDILFGISPIPGVVGTFSAKKGLLKFNAPFNISGTTGTFSGSVRSRIAGGKQRLTVSAIVATTSGGVLYTFDFAVSKKLKK